MKTLVPLLLILFVSCAYAKDVESSADGDICIVRPDLCGGAPLPKKKRTVRRHPASKRAEAARAAEEVEDDLLEAEFEHKSRPVQRRPARERAPLPAAVTYESYLQANASHPAIARRPSSMLMNQRAFVQPAVRSTITGSTLDQQPEAPGAAPGATPATAPSPGEPAPPSSGTNSGEAPAGGSPLH